MARENESRLAEQRGGRKARAHVELAHASEDLIDAAERSVDEASDERTRRAREAEVEALLSEAFEE